MCQYGGVVPRSDDDASGDGQNTVKGGDAMRAEEIRPVDLTTGGGGYSQWGR